MRKDKARFTKVRVSGEVMTLPISELTERSGAVLQELGPQTEALVTRNKETLGVFMSVEKRNELADLEAKYQAALLMIDMLQADRSLDDVRRSAGEVKDRKGVPIDQLLNQDE